MSMKSLSILLKDSVYLLEAAEIVVVEPTCLVC